MLNIIWQIRAFKTDNLPDKIRHTQCKGVIYVVIVVLFSIKSSTHFYFEFLMNNAVYSNSVLNQLHGTRATILHPYFRYQY